MGRTLLPPGLRRTLASAPLPPPSPTPTPTIPRRPPLAAAAAAAAVALASGAAAASYVLGALYPPDFAHLLAPRPAPAPHHRDSVSGRLHTVQLEGRLQELPVVREQRRIAAEAAAAGAGAGDGWYETRPYTTLAPAKAQHSLTAGALKGPGMLAVPPLVFARDDESEAVVVVHLGRSLCGHDGIVHGGLVATVLDEATGRNALLNLPTNIGVTANLNINYRLPTRADQFVTVRTRVAERRGRKVTVDATLTSEAGELLADARAVYVEPKWASLLDGSGVRELLGHRGARYHPPEVHVAGEAAAAADVRA